MATYIADAIEIITDDGTGIISTYSNSAVGLASDGHFYLITGRFNITAGDGKTILGDTSRTTWYDGILSLNDLTISQLGDFVEAGCIETKSSFSFGVNNTAAWWNTLKTNGVYLGRRTVKYYRVTSSDSSTFTFTLRWTGVVDEQPYNELSNTINCVDNSTDIFGTLPKLSINKTAFPSAPNDSLDKYVPITIGRVAYSPLISVKGNGAKTVLCNIGGTDYYVAADTAAENSPGYYVALYTPGVQFLSGDYRLVGKYLHVISGGSSDYTRIWGCGITSGNTTLVYFVESIDLTGHVIWTSGTASSSVRYYEVVDLSPVLVESTNPVYQQRAESNGKKNIYTWDSNTNVYDNISELSFSSSSSNISKTGYPGYSITAKTADDETSLTSLFSIVPTAITKYSETGWSSSSMPAVGASCPLLFDRDTTTGYTLTKTITATTVTNYISFTITPPSESILKQFANIYFVANLTHYGTSSQSLLIRVTVQTQDIYGSAVNTDVTTETIYNSVSPSSSTDLYLIPAFYTNTAESSTNLFNTYKSVLELTSILQDTKTMSAYNRLYVTFSFVIVEAGVSTYNVTFKELGLVGKRSISVSSESVYAPVIGEMFGSQWDTGRAVPKSPTAPIYLLGDALEHLIRNYDTNISPWTAAKAYVVGDKIRSTADNGQIFVCTTSGTSHISIEPTWTTTQGATYSDNTTTWKQLKKIPINTTSFDLVKSQRPDWFIGRTITERKQSIEYYKEICEQSFLILSIASDGLVKIKSWMDNITPSVTFDETNILSGSLSDVTYTPMRRVYNDFTIRYDYNPASKKFNKQLTITNVDKPAFPAVTELAGTITQLSTSFTCTSTAYVIPGYYTLEFTTTSPHNLNAGDYITLTGNTQGYNLTSVPVSTTGLYIFGCLAQITPTATSTTNNGTISALSVARPKWTDYVGGVINYATAKDLWDTCHASYLVTKTVNKNPDSLGECKWLIDPYARNPNGDYIWATNGVLDLNVGDDHPAVYMAQKLVAWTAWQKRQVHLEVADTSTYAALEIGDPVYFNDSKLSNGTAVLAWIHEKTQMPRQQNKIERFKFGVTLAPEGYTSALDNNVIDELGATDIIDETGATNIYDELGA